MAAKVIPEQVAFLVDKYLLDHNFSSTRYTFRNEASRIFAHSPIQEAPKNLMTLNKILDEYISLKNHKVMMDHEMFIIEQEKNRNLMLFQGMHNVMTAFITGGNRPPPAAKSALEFVSQPKISNKSYPACLNRLTFTTMEDKNIPQQVAFIVDKYLLDNNFSSTRSTFRDEASSLIPKEQKSLMTLNEMLDDYISLKEHEIMMDQEKFILAQEKNQIQNLLQGLHDVMTTYNASGNLPSTSAKFTLALVPQSIISNKSHSGVPTFVPNISNTRSQPLSSNSNANGRNISTFSVNVSEKKRKENSAMDTPSAAKRSCSSLSPLDGHILLQQFDDIAFNNPMTVPSSAQHCMTRESTMVPSNSPLPKKYLRTNGVTNISSMETSFAAPCNQEAAHCNQEAAPTCTKLKSSKRVSHDPANQMEYMLMSDIDSAYVPESLNTQLLINENFSPEF